MQAYNRVRETTFMRETSMSRFTVNNNKVVRICSCRLVVDRASLIIWIAFVFLTYSATVEAVSDSDTAQGSIVLPTGELLFEVGNRFLRSVNLSTRESAEIITVPPTSIAQCPTVVKRSKTLVYLKNDVSSGSVIYCNPKANSNETLWSGPVISFLDYNEATEMFAYVRSGSLYVRSKGQPEIEKLVVDKNVRGPISWEPTGTELLYCTKEDEIVILNLRNSKTKVIDNGGWASVSPDGKSIAYRSGNEIRIFDRDNGTTKKLVETDLSFPEQTYDWGQLSWSPDGKWLAYAEGFPRLKNCEATIYLVNVEDGSRIESYKLESCPIGPLLWWRYGDQ